MDNSKVLKVTTQNCKSKEDDSMNQYLEKIIKNNNILNDFEFEFEDLNIFWVTIKQIKILFVLLRFSVLYLNVFFLVNLTINIC